jgi:hypothetical protein
VGHYDGVVKLPIIMKQIANVVHGQPVDKDLPGELKPAGN